MAQEINEGIAYLMALKQSSGLETATVPAPASETPSEGQEGPADSASTAGISTAEPFRGAEKRRSQRHTCEGSAELRETGCDVHTWVTFTDISMHGCYVEAQATYPVGTALHLKLETNGFRVESAGIVRVTYPYLGMGIAFLDMSQENRAHLKQLLASLSRYCVVLTPGIASALPSTGTREAVPLISHPEAAVRALVVFFEDRQTLTREDFLRILNESQSHPTTG